MNAPRAVSALAALAIGFGVTLVGVNVGDDASDTLATSASTEPATGDDETPVDDADEVADEAQQDEEAAEPPPEAEVVVESGPPDTSVGEASPRDTNAPRPADDVEVADCETVLVVETGSGELLILSEELGELEREAGEWYLPNDDVPIEDRLDARAVLELDGVVNDRTGGRSVQDCETGEVFEATVVLDLAIDAGGPTGEQPSGAVFPCSDDAFESLVDELDPLEATELIADADVFLRVLAKSLAGFGSASVGEWEDDLEAQFDRFVDPDGCTPEIERVFIEGGDGFFCAAANLSADQRLFAYLSGVVPGQMTRCSYTQEEG